MNPDTIEIETPDEFLSAWAAYIGDDYDGDN